MIFQHKYLKDFLLLKEFAYMKSGEDQRYCERISTTHRVILLLTFHGIILGIIKFANVDTDK